MRSFAYFQLLRDFLLNGIIDPSLSKRQRKDLRRSSCSFALKDGRLFYTGSHRQYLRLVVLSEEEKRSVLHECHDHPGTGNHRGLRATRDRVVSGYYWPTLTTDVDNWVRCCHQCQLNDPMKTQTPTLHPIKVTEAWDVVGLDLIGPLPETPNGHKYIMTMTDLYTKWVVAEPLSSKTASDVCRAIVNKLYLFGMVRKIITDQGKEFVNELNTQVFRLLNIKHAVSSAYHPQTNGQDERTNQNVKRALRRYVNEAHDDWDVHLPAVVYGINTALQASTKYTPFYLMYHRRPRFPEVMNACPMGDAWEIGDAEELMDTTVAEIRHLNEKVLHNIELAQEKQKKSYGSRKKKSVRVCSINVGDDVLISESPNLGKSRTPAMSSRHQGPFTVTSISTKGVATVRKSDGRHQQLNVKRLRPYRRSESLLQLSKMALSHDHPYWTSTKGDHLYASSGEMWQKTLGPLQDKLLSYVLDTSRPARELIVRDGDLCLVREEFWTLGLPRCMDSSIGNACLRIVKEAAQRQGKDIYIEDMFVVPTWKMEHVDPLVGLPDMRSKDAVLFPAWSRQQDRPDHYLLCVLLVKKREILFLDSLLPNGFSDEVYRAVFRWSLNIVVVGQVLWHGFK